MGCLVCGLLHPIDVCGIGVVVGVFLLLTHVSLLCSTHKYFGYQMFIYCLAITHLPWIFLYMEFLKNTGFNSLPLNFSVSRLDFQLGWSACLYQAVWLVVVVLFIPLINHFRDVYWFNLSYYRRIRLYSVDNTEWIFYSFVLIVFIICIFLVYY